MTAALAGDVYEFTSLLQSTASRSARWFYDALA